MKRAGFTMIELIFVIVILGILASVALPKLIGVKDQADEGLIKGFVGTLNRTVAPAKWSASIANDENGTLRNSGTKYDINSTDTDLPASFASTIQVAVANCKNPLATTGNLTDVAVTKDSKYGIVCRDGNASSAPRFWYYQKTNAAGTAVTIAPADLNDSKIKLN